MAMFGGWRLTKAGMLFIVGIILLGGLVTTGVVVVKNRGETVRREQAIEVARQNLEDQSKVGTQPVNEPVASDETTTAEASNDVAVLPETGIDVMVIGQAAILGMLTFAVTSFIVSRRAGLHL